MSFLKLPLELQNKILINLDGVSLANAERVCRTWRDLLSSGTYNLIWRRECIYCIHKSVLVEITGIENITECEPNSNRSHHSSTALPGHVWKAIYRRWYIARKVGKWPVMENEIQTLKGLCSLHQ